MHGHRRPQVGHHPLGHGLDLRVTIVVARDEQGGQFHPDLGLMVQVL